MRGVQAKRQRRAMRAAGTARKRAESDEVVTLSVCRDCSRSLLLNKTTRLCTPCGQK